MYKLTVIICVYNEEESLFGALRSLYSNAIYPDTEIIFIDDCSTNPVTGRILALIAKFTRHRVVYSAENKGLSNSRNTGFREATTPYILPLDADDCFPESTLDRIYEAFIKNPEADFIVGNYLLNNMETGAAALVDCSRIAEGEQVNKTRLAADWILLGTSPCKKITWQKAGGYDLKYSYSVQDMDFWIRVLMGGAKGLFLNEPIYIWNRSDHGMNAKIGDLEIAELLNDHQLFFLLKTSAGSLSNRIFEGFYPYKQKNRLMRIGMEHFFRLSAINKLRFIRFMLTNLLKRTSASS